MSDIHSTALIDPKAEIGEGCRIGPFCIVGPNVRLGRNVWLQSQVRIDRDTEIGEDCRIYHGASVGNDPQDLKYHGEESRLTVGARTVIREFATLHRGTIATRLTTVGSDCLLMNYVHVAHDCRVGNHAILANSVQIGGHAEIGDWAIVGGLSGVHQFTRVGAHCMIGFGFRVSQDVVPYMLAAGEPLRPMGLNVTGLERRGFTAETIADLKSAFKILFRENRKLSDSLAILQEKFPKVPEIQAILQFIAQGKRGLAR